MMAARHHCRTANAAALRIVPRSQALPSPDLDADIGAWLSAADWHLLFDAVMCRLREAASQPATAAVVVPECVEALEHLQALLDPHRTAARRATTRG
jgi:hypothetical protein